VNDVLTAQLMEQPSVPSIVHLGVTHMMRAIMNIFQFMSANGTQFRQHVLLSTTFADSCSIMYLQAQVRTMASIVASSGGRSAFPPELLGGIALALKFMCFATFHMGRHARCIRPLCTFVDELLKIPVRQCIEANPGMLEPLQKVYTNLFHFLANIDALGGDEGVMDDSDDYIAELTSAAIHGSLRGFVEGNVTPHGYEALDKWHARLYTIDHDGLVSQDTTTWQAIDRMFHDAKGTGAAMAPVTAAAPVPEPAKAHSLLGDLPSMTSHRTPHAPGGLWAAGTAPVARAPGVKAPIAGEAVSMTHAFVVNQKTKDTAAHSKYLCALNGNTLKVPVRSPYGQVFEKDTIEMWLRQQGNVCPITGKPLSPEDLTLDRALQNEIMHVMVQQTMAARSHEAETDMYDF